MESRDWYRDWWRKRTGYEERARFRVPAGQEGRATDDNWDAGGEYLSGGKKARHGLPDLVGANLHWSIKLILMLCALVALLALRSALK